MKIGFLGFGNMGKAFAEGLINSNAIKPSEIYAVAKNVDKLKLSCEKMNINACEFVEDMVEKIDWVIIAVKPHQVESVIEPVKQRLKNKVVISVAVGMLFDTYEKILLEGTQHISFLPNTACAVCSGVIVVEKNHSLSNENFRCVKNVFSQIALFEVVETNQFGISGVIAGCGPAYAAMFIEALGDAGVRFGLPRSQAYTLAAKMLEGTAALKLKTGSHPAQMKDAVCSPGGTTIKGVLALEKYGFRNAVIEAINAASN